jgi:hypothetical protein
MLPRGSGHIVNVASAAGRIAVPGEAVYTATKHAVVGFGEALRAELRGKGIEISTIMPSLAATELAAGMQPPRFVPMVKPEQVARAIAGTLERPKLEVVVPAWTTPLIRMTMALPPSMRDGVRRVTEVVEITGLEEEVILTGSLFTYRYLGENQDGTLKGVFESTQVRPRFLKRLDYFGLAAAFLDTLSPRAREGG